jgi:TatD DNase family protein
MFLIDTHTHLFSEAFNEDRSEVVGRSIRNGVEKMLLPNIDVSSIEPLFALCHEFPTNCFPMMGLHPGSVSATWKEDLAVIETHLFSRNVIAVGEIGMDLYWDKTFIEEQKKAFSIQIDWAIERKLPIVIHARESFDEIFNILDQKICSDLHGVFHCFTGSDYEVQKILSYENFYFGIGGVITYKNSQLPEVIKKVPLSKILLETDSPYLPPTPFRGKRNEPSYLIYVAEKLASVYEIGLDVIAKETSENAKKLFKLKS